MTESARKLILPDNNARALRVALALCLALALVLFVAVSSPLGAFVEESNATASEAPTIADPSEEGGVSPDKDSTGTNEPVVVNAPDSSPSFQISYRAYQTGYGWTAFQVIPALREAGKTVL